MKNYWVILLGGLVFLEKAEARLGETAEQIISRTGTGSLYADPSNQDDLVTIQISDFGGFDAIFFSFFRTKDRKGPSVDLADFSGKCIAVSYVKYYPDWEAIKAARKFAGGLLLENYPDASTHMHIVNSDGISGDVPEGRIWSVRWKGKNGETADADVAAGIDNMPRLNMDCRSAEYVKFLIQKIENKK